jgi:hypothetical protein
LAGMLRSAGFLIITLYDEYADAESRIADPVLIYDCGFKGRVLMTADKEMAFTWAKEIADAAIAVFVVTNNEEGPKQWGPRIIAAKRYILRELRRRAKPFTATISSEGRISHVRIYENGKWRTIQIPTKNPPHENKYKGKSNSPISSA